MAWSMMDVGDRIGDPTEVSRLRYEDFKTNMPISEWEDIEQYNSNPGATSTRGFTFPMAYLQMTSGLDKVRSALGRTLVPSQALIVNYFCHFSTAVIQRDH